MKTMRRCRSAPRLGRRRGLLGLELLGEMLAIGLIVGGIVILAVFSGLAALIGDDPHSAAKSAEAHLLREPVYRVQLSADGRTLASFTRNADILLHDAPSGRETSRIRLLADHPTAVAVAPDEDLMLVGYARGHVMLWRGAAGDGDVRRLPGKHEDTIRDAAFSPCGRLAATVGSDGEVRVWDTAAGAEYWRRQANAGGLNVVQFSPDGRRLLFAASDLSIRLWDVETGDEIRRLVGHTAFVAQARFTPDGRRVISAGFDGAVRAWNLADGKQLWHAQTETYGVRSLGVSRDGRLVAAAGFDKQISIRDADTGRLKRRFPGHERGVTGLEFLPGGRTLISGGYDGTIRYWNVASGEEIRRVMVD